ncbi:MAG TPA: glycosyltransferase [Gemmataceae bacterium]|nr:glycosyltransferase [Gemmataceae bacterium]
MPGLHVAVLDEELPYPLTSGKRIRSFNLLTRLAKSHRVTYIAHRNADPDEVRPAAKALRDHDVFPIVVDYRVPPKAGAGFYARLLRNVLSPLPYSVATHASRAMQGAMDRLVATDPPDLWHCEWTPYAQAMHGRPGRWVVMAHNVESVIWRRMAEAEENPLKRWFIRQQWKKFEAFEAWAYTATTQAIAVSREDSDRIEGQFGARDVAVVDNGVDTAFFRPDPAVARDPSRILFLGSLDWRPNLDAVRLLLDDIFPKVRVAEPRATLLLVGRKPPDGLRDQVERCPGVELHADVPDVRPFLHAAGVLAVPLRIGGGSRLKILEALAAGLPVLTTTVGVEGLRLTPGEHCSLADGTDAFAAALLAALRGPEPAREQAARGRARVLAEYDWSRLAAQLDRVWLDAAEPATASRRAAA